MEWSQPKRATFFKIKVKAFQAALQKKVLVRAI